MLPDPHPTSLRSATFPQGKAWVRRITPQKTSASGRGSPGRCRRRRGRSPCRDTAGNPVKDVKGNTVRQISTDKNGVARFADLPYGKYQITEVKTLPGYSLLTEPLDVTLPAEYTEEEAGKQKIDTANVFYSPKEGKYYITQLSYSVSDSAVLKMPDAGNGRYLAGMSGIVLIGAAVWYYSVRRRIYR